MIILGLDPGTVRVGYGLVEKSRDGVFFLKCGILKIKSDNRYERLLEVEKDLSRFLKTEKPDLVAIEKLYFAKNQKTGMAVAEARGLLTFIILKHKIPLLEFTPLEMKRGLTGYGLAKKPAVKRVVAKILRIKKIPGGDDAADALAMALVAAGSAFGPTSNMIFRNNTKGRSRA